MCELLGISSEAPVQVEAMLRAFQRRGGEIADNPDGWGLAFLSDGRFTLGKEPLPAAGSARFMRLAETIHTDLLIGHVRKARLPRINTLANTHPFQHACCDREWVFAHNGLVPEAIELAQRDPHPPCTPAGETDSEHAFCHLLENISHHFRDEPSAAGMEPWLEALAVLSGLIASHGKFNFLISDGIYLIAYGHDRLHYQERQGDGDNHEAWIATEPLTADHWQPFEAGELRIYRKGRLVGRLPTQGGASSFERESTAQLLRATRASAPREAHVDFATGSQHP